MQAHIFVSGYVQGVWYRKFVKKNALNLGITGWARNLPDNRVEAVIQGKEDKIDELIALCKKGPPFAEVKNVQVEWEESKEEFKDFSITH